MTIYFIDGSTAQCSEVEFTLAGKIIWDGVRSAWLSDVDTIEDDETEEA